MLRNGGDFSLFLLDVADEPFFLDARCQLDDAGCAVQTGYVGKVPGKFKADPSGFAAEIQGISAHLVRKQIPEAVDQPKSKVRSPIQIAERDNGGVILIEIVFSLHQRGAADIPESGMLIEVTAKGIPGIADSFIACGDEAAALDQIVAGIKGRNAEIVVIRVDLEARERGNGSLCPLPHVSNDVIKLAKSEAINGTGGCPVFQVDIARSLVPIRQIGIQMAIADCVPLRLSGHADGQSRHLCLPIAKGLGLQIVHFHGVIPGHGNQGGYRAQEVFAFFSHRPKAGMLCLLIAFPCPSFGSPVLLSVISASIDELPVLGIGYQKARCLKVLNIVALFAILVVPAIKRI